MCPPRNSRVLGGGCIVVWMSQKLTPTDLARIDTDRPFRVGSALSGEVAKRTGLRGRFNRLASRVFSRASRCPTCDQRNPADSRYCSACGGSLHLPPHLVSCPRCGVVGQATATVCFWCHGPLPGRRADSDVLSSPTSRAFRLQLLRPSLVIAGAAALGALVVLGYANYRQPSPVEAPRPSAASVELSDRAAPVPRPPAETPAPKTSAPVVARPQVTSADRAAERQPPRPVACTEGVAALGLCATEAKAAEAAIRAPQANNPGAEVGREPSDPTCTEAAAAVGICARPAQRRQ
jgi:hypothetical protein